MTRKSTRESRDAAEELAEDVVDFVTGLCDDYAKAKEATKGTEQIPHEEMLKTREFYVNTGKSVVSLGWHGLRTKASEVLKDVKDAAAKLEKDVKDAAAKLEKVGNPSKLLSGKAAAAAVELEKANIVVEAALDSVTAVKAVYDDCNNGSIWETSKSVGKLVVDFASKINGGPSKLLSGKNLSITSKSISMDVCKHKLVKLNTVTTAVDLFHAGWDCWKEGSAKPLVKLVARTAGNVVVQGFVRGALVAIGSPLGPFGVAVCAGIGGYDGEKIGGFVADKAKKAWGWIKSWFSDAIFRLTAALAGA